MSKRRRRTYTPYPCLDCGGTGYEEEAAFGSGEKLVCEGCNGTGLEPRSR